MAERRFCFTIETEASDCAARACVLDTPHGTVQTPVFMPVGTRATVKGVLPDQLEELHAQIVLANTYHLYLRPGSELIAEAGGLHRFMGWNHPILTDSGGFQLFSLADTLKIDDEGVSFSSIIDGSRHYWTPQSNMQVQNQLGADIVMQLDQCTAYPVDRRDAATAVARSAQWAQQCREAQNNPEQALFAIVQGSTYRDLRLESVARLLEIDSKSPQSRFEGFGIGGYSVGEPHELMFETLGEVAAALPMDRPHYLMGVGNPSTLLRSIALGVDMFDCVLPTRTARLGTAFTSEGRMNLRNARFTRDFAALDSSCDCPTCTNYSRSYLRHLILSKEILSSVLLSLHNLHFLLNLMESARSAIIEDRYLDFLKAWNESEASRDF